jgi:hypothetical protein
MNCKPPCLPVDRHIRLGNLLNDVFEELNDIAYSSGANDLIVRRAENAAVAVNRLRVALEDDLLATALVDPRLILERVYRGFDRSKPVQLDIERHGLADWKEG